MQQVEMKKKLSGLMFCAVFVCLASLAAVGQTQPPIAGQPAATHKRTVKTTKKAEKPPKPQLPPISSGPTGQPVQQIPLDSIAAVPPQVSYQNNQLTIVAPNSTLADILKAVRKQTGAEIEVPSAPERVVTRLGPGPARDVMAELLNGSRFNYILLGAPDDDVALTRIVLVAKSGAENMAQNAVPVQNQQVNNVPPQIQPQQPDQPAEMANDAEQVDDNSNDDNADQQQVPVEAEQQQPAPDQQPPGVKTPQQLLQEMQQRQLQLQQQQPPGQPPIPGSGVPPGSGMPPHPPPQNP